MVVVWILSVVQSLHTYLVLADCVSSVTHNLYKTCIQNEKFDI